MGGCDRVHVEQNTKWIADFHVEEYQANDVFTDDGQSFGGR